MARFTKKTKIAIVTAALVIGASGTAYAYWTQLGAGTGSAGTGTTAAVTAIQTSAAITDLYPGGPAKALSGNFNNPNLGDTTVGAVTATVTAATGTCNPTWYAITGTPIPATNQVLVGSGTGVGAWSGQSVSLTNLPLVNQDACKNATITITYAVAAS